MRTLRLLAATAALALGAGITMAQPGPGYGRGPGMGPGPAGSAPNGMPMRGGMGPRWGSDFTPGWSLMTEQERAEHQTRMRAMTNHDECTAYMAQHHEQMVARAKEKGATIPAQPRRDPCAGLK